MKIVLVPHSSEWTERFLAEAERLSGVFGTHILEIHHAGSTSVPGIKAKPIIDVVMVVDDIRAIEGYNEQMAGLGYEAMYEFGIPGRRFFRRDVEEQRTHNVHIFQKGHPEIERMLAFRDYLRTHPEEAKKYEQLKEILAKQFPEDMTTYARAKSDFVEAILREAFKKPASENG